MNKRLFLLLVGLFVLACKHPFLSVNYRDKKGLLQGKWKVFYPDTKQLYYTGRFNNSVPKRLVYYYPDGKVYRREKYQRGGRIHTTFFYTNGFKELEGDAVLVQNGDTSLYQWQGPWHKYDSSGKPVAIHTYRNGYIIWIKKLEK